MWNHTRRIVLAIAVALTITGSGLPAATSAEAETSRSVVAASELADAPQPLELVDLPDDMADMVSWAVGLFAQADLELPPLRVVHHSGDRSQCHGRDGFHHRVGPVNVVEICAADASGSTQVMVLHEIAHAWADHSLSDEAKAAFQELRGWDAWRDHASLAWHDNGTEQAAEIMVWGLIDRPIAMIRIGQNSCDELEAGYVALTGAQPLHGYRDHC